MSKQSRSKYQQALRLARHKNADWSRVFALLEEASTNGDHEATYAIATWHIHGKPELGLKPSLTKAVAMLKVAAETVPDAMHDLAHAYEVGDGIRPSPAKAFYWYFRGFLAMDEGCHIELTRCYFYGIGTPKNVELARALEEDAKRKNYDVSRLYDNSLASPAKSRAASRGRK